MMEILKKSSKWHNHFNSRYARWNCLESLLYVSILWKQKGNSWAPIPIGFVIFANVNMQWGRMQTRRATRHHEWNNIYNLTHLAILGTTHIEMPSFLRYLHSGLSTRWRLFNAALNCTITLSLNNIASKLRGISLHTQTNYSCFKCSNDRWSLQDWCY